MTADIEKIPYLPERVPEAEMTSRAQRLLETLRTRRSVRDFSPEAIPLDAVRRCIECAAKAPSGANKQPWTFVLVTDPAVKREIRLAAEAEEQAFYGGRAPERWLADLMPLGTDANKPFLETAPALIVIFGQKTGPEGERHYYVSESVGIATGFLISALHQIGLATLTHTPSPMGFLTRICRRPANERPYLLLPIGFPATECQVPKIQRKEPDDFFVEL